MRADIGTADTPAISNKRIDLVVFAQEDIEKLHKQDTGCRCDEKATSPRKKIPRVLHEMNSEACVDAPTVIPKRIVIVSINGPFAVSANRRVAPLSLSKLPKKSIPRRGSADGTTKQVSNKPTIGKMIFSV